MFWKEAWVDSAASLLRAYRGVSGFKESPFIVEQFL